MISTFELCKHLPDVYKTKIEEQLKPLVDKSFNQIKGCLCIPFLTEVQLQIVYASLKKFNQNLLYLLKV
jgi:hypothetical protein